MKVKLFRQLCTDPIARHSSVPVTWYHEKRGGGYAYGAELPGNSDVRLLWRPSVKLEGTRPRIRVEPRGPTAICMQVLFTLLATVQRGRRLRFTSRRDLVLKAMGTRIRAGTPYYNDAVLDALRMWQQLGVHWLDLKMPPPIKRVKWIKIKGRQTRQLEIELHPAWERQCNKDRMGWFGLPLPMYAVIQNMILKTLADGTQEGIEINPFFAKVSGNRRCDKITPHVPLESWVHVKGWYLRYGGRLEWHRRPYERVMQKTAHRFKLIPSREMDVRVWRPKAYGR